MSELPMSSSPKNAAFFQTLRVCISNFISLCCLPVFSQPLYFCYFLFFSPYIVKLLSFLSPLFVTTSLVLLSLLPSVQELNFVSLLAGEPDLSEELEFYKILFETRVGDAVGEEIQETVDKFLIHVSTVDEEPVEENETEVPGSKTGEEALFQEKEEPDGITALSMVEGQEFKVKPPGTVSKKVVAGQGEREGPALVRGEPNARLGDMTRSFNLSGDGVGIPGDASPGLGVSGSMRKEKEWRRTLACKLFEERHNGGGEEGMDLLWERYEDGSSRAQCRRKDRKNKGDDKVDPGPGPREKPERRREVEDEDEDEAEAEEDVDEVKICCLQALKFSAGKVNLGLGRPNMMRISKALRGIGWLHHSVRGHTKKSVKLI